MDELDQLQSRVLLTLCHMEMLFPPSFFTVMIHLIVHLVEDAKLGGPVQYIFYTVKNFTNYFYF